MSKLVFVYDYMGGWLNRGIPLFTRNLISSLRVNGIEVCSLKSFAAQSSWPRMFNHVLDVLAEQFLAPLVWRIAGARAAIYPYNSMPIIDIFCKRAHIVVHDTMAFKHKCKTYTQVYYRLVYYFIQLSKRTIFTVAPHEIERLREFGFRNNPILLLPNSFENFRRLLAQQPAAMRNPGAARRLMLCTGRGPCKDLPYVWKNLLPMAAQAGWSVEVFGLSGLQSSDEASLGSLSLPEGVTVLPNLTDEQVVQAYLRADVVWVHSLQEGFGRCVIEGRLCGRPVVCSNIIEFQQLADEGVLLYNDERELMAAIDSARTWTLPPKYSAYDDTALLAEAISRVIA